MQTTEQDVMFSGVIGQEYDLLKLICPLATEMSRLVGIEVAQFQANANAETLQIIELGGGTGITTLNLLKARNDLHVTSVDNEPVMQEQAKQSLAAWFKRGCLSFCADDALTALKNIQSDSVDIVATAYTLHNFLQDYRGEVLREIYRVLKSGGLFVNGDRYALNDIATHTRLVQEEVSGYFAVLSKINRFDLLEHWIVHLLSDESENHIMRESPSLYLMQQTGFVNITLAHRQEVNALLTALKPGAR